MFALTGAVSILTVIKELRDLELWDEVFGWVILIIDPYKLVQELIFLQRHAKNTLKILISSRYQKRIAQLLKEVGTIQLSQDKTKADFDRYIRQAVERAVHDGWIVPENPGGNRNRKS
jgi:hypothetical protein